MQEKNTDAPLIQKPNTPWPKIFAVVIGTVVGIWIVIGYYPIALQKTPEAAGQFGDMFGMVNALFSGLAFAGLIVTIWMQREDIELQRRTIELQIEELKLQREITEQSKEELARQADFSEKTNLLNRLNMINEGFMLISGADTSQVAFSKLRVEYVERLYLSGVINIRDNRSIDDLWSHSRDAVLLNIYSLKSYIEKSAKWHREGGRKHVNPHVFIDEVNRWIEKFIHEPSLAKWFGDIADFRSSLIESKNDVIREPIVFTYVLDTPCTDFIALLDVISGSLRILDLRSIIENSKEFAKFSEIPKAN